VAARHARVRRVSVGGAADVWRRVIPRRRPWVAVAWPELHGRALQQGIVAGCLNALGCVFFAYVLTRQNRAELGRDIMISLVIQVGLNAAWAAYQSGAMIWRLALGSITAVVTILLFG